MNSLRVGCFRIVKWKLQVIEYDIARSEDLLSWTPQLYSKSLHPLFET